MPPGAAAVALLQGADPRPRRARRVPGWSRERMRVRVDGRRVTVRLRPPSPIPALAGLLEARRRGRRRAAEPPMSLRRARHRAFRDRAGRARAGGARGLRRGRRRSRKRACADPAPRTPPGVAAAVGGRRCARARGGAGAGAGAHAARRRPWSASGVPASGRGRRGGLRRCGRRAASRRASARGHDARPAGRLASLGSRRGAPTRRCRPARRAAAGAAPTVLALGGPRAAAFDELLARAGPRRGGAAVRHGAVLARLALAGLSRRTRARASASCRPRAGATLAAAGLDLLPSMRRALAGAVAELLSPSRGERGQATILSRRRAGAARGRARSSARSRAGIGVQSDQQRAADLAALAGARAMHEAYPRCSSRRARRAGQPGPPRARGVPRARASRGAGDRAPQRRARRRGRLPGRGDLRAGADPRRR